MIGPRGPKGPTGATGPTGAHNNDTIHKVRKISYHLGKLKNFFNHHINVADSLFDEPDEKDYSTLPKEVLNKKLSLLGGASEHSTKASAKRVAMKTNSLKKLLESYAAPKSKDERTVFKKTDTDELFRTQADVHSKLGSFCRERRKNPATCGSCCNYSKRMIKEFKLCNVESERCKESEKEHSVCLSLRDKCYKNVRKNDETRDE